VEEPRGTEVLWKKLGATTKASPKLWMDAYLAAFAVAGEFSLVTTDKGFKQFKGLDVVILAKGIDE
jgi:predicted nucleic acid-binding protein